MTEYIMQVTIRKDIPKRKIRKIEKEARIRAVCGLAGKMEEGKYYRIRIRTELDERFNIFYPGTFDYYVQTEIEECQTN